jgi:multiple sugar transport system permease protein
VGRDRAQHLQGGPLARRRGRTGLPQLHQEQPPGRPRHRGADAHHLDSGAYAVSRLEFFGRRQISGLFLGVYFFPAILLAIPLFVFFTRIGQRGTLLGLLVVYVAQVAAVSIYMLRNYFDTIPASVEEAAALDGCTRLRAMWHVSLPLAMPAIASNALFIFMIAWNEFLFALLFLIERRENWTVSLGLSQLSGSIEVPTTVLMAGSVILTLPIIVMFFLSERWLAGGLTAGAEKG